MTPHAHGFSWARQVPASLSPNMLQMWQSTCMGIGEKNPFSNHAFHASVWIHDMDSRIIYYIIITWGLPVTNGYFHFRQGTLASVFFTSKTGEVWYFHYRYEPQVLVGKACLAALCLRGGVMKGNNYLLECLHQFRIIIQSLGIINTGIMLTSIVYACSPFSRT